MAIGPIKPDELDKEAMIRYNQDLEDKKRNPHKWAVTPSVITQSVRIQEEKRQNILKSKESNVKSKKK